MEATPHEIVICQTSDGREPFTEWLFGRDAQTRARIFVRIDRVESGNFGEMEPVGGGVSELKFEFGPGYRVYFGQKGLEVHLISGGDKKSQERDIVAAKRFWKHHG